MPRVRRLLAAVACAAAMSAVIVWLAGGVTLHVAGFTVSSHDPVRPGLAAVAALVAYVLVAGIDRAQRDVLSISRAVAAPTRLAFALAIATTVIGILQNSWTAAGADAYAYVSQADLWLQGSLKVAVPIAAIVPWPNGLATFTPFGYRAAVNGAALVPVTAPGLPLLMALLEAIGGHCALFLVAPICGGALVWTTFAIGRRIQGPPVGLAAAWIGATSPVFLSMFKSPMSDVPAAAFWALAILGMLGHSRASAAAAGLSASVATLIRPNLVPLALAIAGWSVWRERRDGVRRPVRALAFAAGVIPACVAIGAINFALYGSPLTSGYGGLPSLFSIGHMPANLRRYGGWLIETQTPLAVIGLAALFVPSRWLWPMDLPRAARLLLALTVIVTWCTYLAYTPFDAWWYLRFLLPAWPAMAVGTSAVALAIARHGNVWTARGVTVAVLALGVYQIATALTLGVFPVGERDRRYATIAEHVGRVTRPSAAIITGQHVGSVRYYAGRLTLRFDLLDEAWLDRAVAWLDANGRHPYFLLEDWEVPLFETKFAAKNVFGRVNATPILAYKSYHTPGTIYLFDPLRTDAVTERPPSVADPRPRCVKPSERGHQTVR